MKVDILTREYPPYVYGGAGVHAEELSKVLAERVDVTVPVVIWYYGVFFRQHEHGHCAFFRRAMP